MWNSPPPVATCCWTPRSGVDIPVDTIAHSAQDHALAVDCDVMPLRGGCGRGAFAGIRIKP